jgi:hypothetical protein
MSKKEFSEGYDWGVKYALSRKVGYMDKIDFDNELGCARGGNTVFASIADLRENTAHDIDECGIVKVEVTLLEVVQYEDYAKAKANVKDNDNDAG